jgi:pimeloyl-ACP methyl ester carboxylesterase
MGGFLADLIAECDLGSPHLVAPDVGTSAALFAAAAHPERVAGVIVGTGGAAVPIELGEPLRSWVLDPDLDKYRGMRSSTAATTASYRSPTPSTTPPRRSAPSPENPPPNTLGLHRVMLAVDDIDDAVARLRAHGAELLGRGGAVRERD